MNSNTPSITLHKNGIACPCPQVHFVSFLMSPFSFQTLYSPLSLQSQTPSAKQEAYFPFSCFSPKLLEASVPNIDKHFWVFGLISAIKANRCIKQVFI